MDPRYPPRNEREEIAKAYGSASYKNALPTSWAPCTVRTSSPPGRPSDDNSVRRRWKRTMSV
jgi:hypothetical protein